MTHRILAVDPHPITLKGYETLLRPEPNLTLSNTVKTSADALGLVREKRIDLVLTELHLEDGGGFEFVKQLTTVGSEIDVIVISHFDDTVFGSRALRAGARGYLQKKAVGEEILEAIQTVLDGGVHLSDTLQQIVMNTFVGEESENCMEALTDRELEVFAGIGAGLSTREIAERLHISIKTVQTHRSNIMDKLGASTKEKLLRQAVIWRLENAPPVSDPASQRKGT